MFFGQDLGDQFFEAGCMSEPDQMTQQRRSNTVPLVLIDGGERRFGLARLNEEYRPTDNCGAAL